MPWILSPLFMQPLNTIKIPGILEVRTLLGLFRKCSSKRYIPWEMKVGDLKKFQTFLGKVCVTWICMKTACEI